MYELINDKTLAEYEAFLQQHPKGHFAQSSLWAKQKPMWAWNAVAVRGEDGKIKGSLALMSRKVPGIGRTLMYGCRGPVCDLRDRETFAELLEGAKALAKQQKAYVIKIDPDVPSSDTAFAEMMRSFGFRCKEGGKNFEAIQPRYVFRLNVEGKTEDELLRYLYYTSARCIRRLEEPKYNDLMSIVHSPDTDKERVTQFNKYISEPENLKKLLRVFPIVATTCISAHRLGDPEPSFDMVIMDEASQCSTAMSLVPILRGASLMLVGDPQQLSPVILLDPADNKALRRKYSVTEEYDYIENSIYKCFLACDAVSDETLLSYHYRCSPKIIEFNNRKYYNHKLHIASRETDPTPLVYVDVPNDTTDEKNTAPQEVRRIDAYLSRHPDKQVGIITPFARQRAAIEAMLRANHYDNASCGTVHAFQGDEKDVVIFSLALTDQTREKTYAWLKTNKELINVATSRAREQLVILSNQAALDRLHADSTDDDIYELVQYVRKNGQSEVTEKPAASRALGIKPYSTKTEDAFLENLNHALDNAFLDGSRCTVRKEVPIAQVFEDNPGCADLFYTGRFDFVVYQREGRRLMPILAIELDGREHRDDPAVRRRDRKKDQICREHGFELIRVENSYARRYNYIKSILINYFRKVS